MSKKVRIILILILVFIPIVYVYSGFYRIEHIHNEDGNLLITKTDEINKCLNNHTDAFNNVADMLINDNMTHDYYYDDELLKDNESFLVLRNQCNVLWIRINAYRNCITFYQTMNTHHNNIILLSYECRIDQFGTRTWSCTSDFPEANKKKTLIMKLYDMCY